MTTPFFSTKEAFTFVSFQRMTKHCNIWAWAGMGASPWCNPFRSHQRIGKAPRHGDGKMNQQFLCFLLPPCSIPHHFRERLPCAYHKIHDHFAWVRAISGEEQLSFPFLPNGKRLPSQEQKKPRLEGTENDNSIFFSRPELPSINFANLNLTSSYDFGHKICLPIATILIENDDLQEGH